MRAGDERVLLRCLVERLEARSCCPVGVGIESDGQVRAIEPDCRDMARERFPMITTAATAYPFH